MPATNRFTLNRLQFFGMMTREYLDQIRPVAANAAVWGILIASAGRCRSAIPAMTNPYEQAITLNSKFGRNLIEFTHLKHGAQKKIVLGPGKINNVINWYKGA